MDTKIVGYTMLGIGLAIMIFAASYIVMSFTNIIEPIPLFGSTDITSDKPAATTTPVAAQGVAGMLSQFKSDALSQIGQQIIPTESINKILNLTSTFFLMTFLGGFGYKIASLGIMMARPIYVKLKTKNVEAVNEEK